MNQERDSSQAGQATGPNLEADKLVRLASVVGAVLDEARHQEPDEKATKRLRTLHERVVAEIREAVPEELQEELFGLAGGLPEEGASTGEVRIAYAALLGWLQGVFNGLQVARALVALPRREIASETQPRLPPPAEGQYL